MQIVRIFEIPFFVMNKWLIRSDFWFGEIFFGYLTEDEILTSFAFYGIYEEKKWKLSWLAIRKLGQKLQRPLLKF